MTRRLHVGGLVRREGCEVISPMPGEHVDHVGNANNLSRFRDGTFAEIYASHVVEHFDYRDELQLALQEWFRVLQPGGRLLISVPDLDVLAALLLQKDALSLNERFEVLRMIFGGHIDAYDYHMVGLNEAFLDYFLVAAGFVNSRRVASFDLFEDTSSLLFRDVPISLNLIAEKPPRSEALE
jgi:predicted SAM-dependent methyltransferase